VLMQSRSFLQKGDRAPDFSLPGVDGKTYSLDDFKGAKALLVVFMCNHCPYVKAKVSRLNEIYGKYRDKGLALVGINSNDTENYPEDSFENMKEFARENSIEFPYLFDESQETAKAYGAVCTPDPFLFDSGLRLACHGRLDNAMNPGDKPTEFDMDEAIERVLNGQEVPEPWRPSQGCSIKWRPGNEP